MTNNDEPTTEQWMQRINSLIEGNRQDRDNWAKFTVAILDAIQANNNSHYFALAQENSRLRARIEELEKPKED